MTTHTTLPSPEVAIAQIDEQVGKTQRMIAALDPFRDELKIAGLKTIIDGFLDQRLKQMDKRDALKTATTQPPI